MLRDKWKDLIDGESDVRADDINIIAHQVMDNEESIENISKSIGTANTELESILAGGVD